MVDLIHWEWANEKGPRGNVREAVALFDSEDDMQAAVDDLGRHGFSNAAISRPVILDKIEAVKKRIIKNIKDMEDDSEVPRQAYTENSSRTEGLTVVFLIPVYILVMGAAGLAGAHGLDLGAAVFISMLLGLLGVIVGGYSVYKLSQMNNKRIRGEQERGGFLLWVRTGNNSQEAMAVDILRRHAGRDVHLHGPTPA